MIFTANGSGAMRILAETFPFESRSRFVLTADNHNSVNGIRVAAQRQGACLSYVPLTEQLLSEDPLPHLPRVPGTSLFAYPAQSNFSGVPHPPGWIRDAQEAGYRVLLDAAAFLPTHAISLEDHPADFVALSFYKIFGYPTGVGAVVARHEALASLRRGYFAGGTVEFVSVQHEIEQPKAGAESLEDGTPHFLALSAVCEGLEWLNQIGMDKIQRHTEFLTDHFLLGLTAMRDRVCFYGPDSTNRRGSTVAFNLHRNGQIVPFELVEVAARDAGIAIRGGCFCNPGAAERAFNVPAERALACFEEPDLSIPKLRAFLGGGAVGALRASFGVGNNVRDVDRLVEFLRNTDVWSTYVSGRSN